MAKTWLYHPDEPEGRIFDDAESAGPGWVDSPAKIGAEPVADPYSPDPYHPDPYTDEPKKRGGRPRKVTL